MGFGSSSELPKHPAATVNFRLPGNLAPGISPNATGSAFPEVSDPLSVSPLVAAAYGWVCYFPTTSVFRFSQPLDAFIRLKPAGLLSCRIRSWARPSKPSSSHAAVRHFRRPFPLDVSTSSGLFLRTRIRFPTKLFRP
jgi:hypothetical protein